MLGTIFGILAIRNLSPEETSLALRNYYDVECKAEEGDMDSLINMIEDDTPIYKLAPIAANATSHKMLDVIMDRLVGSIFAGVDAGEKEYNGRSRAARCFADYIYYSNRFTSDNVADIIADRFELDDDDLIIIMNDDADADENYMLIQRALSSVANAKDIFEAFTNASLYEDDANLFPLIGAMVEARWGLPEFLQNVIQKQLEAYLSF